MSRSDLNIPNTDGARFRAAINQAFSAVRSGQSGRGLPLNPVKYQRAIDTSNDREYIWDGSRWVDRGNVFS